MQIKIENRIRGKYHTGFSRGENQPDEIVIHGTDGLGTIKWMMWGSRAEQYKQGIGLFHYLIDRNGDVTEIIDPDKWVYHSSSGLHDRKTIGIEISKSKNSNPPTSAQYDALNDLIEFLSAKYPIETVTTHDYNRKKYSGLEPKPCPGEMNWSKIKAEVVV